MKQWAAAAGLAMDAAEESERFANQRIKQGSDERKRLERKIIEPLDKLNPAAQLTDRMASLAKEELSEIRAMLNEAAAEMNASEDLLADPQKTEVLRQRQSRVSDEIQLAADNLRRIARHQERLGEGPASERSAKIADQIEQEAKVASKNAESDLNNAVKSPERSPQANRQITLAEQAIRDVGGRLSAELNSEGDKGQDSGESSSQSDRQLAQTLDELDRSIARRQQSADMLGEGDQPGDGQTPGSAGAASPTLSSALRSIAQQAARQRRRSPQSQPGSSEQGSSRQGSIRQGSPEPGELASSEDGTSSDVTNSDGTNSDGSNSDGSRSDQSTNGQGNPPGDIPGEPSVAIDGVERKGGQWGQLRRRVDDNTGQTQRGLMPNQYRQEIEAYFRVIARESGGER